MQITGFFGTQVSHSDDVRDGEERKREKDNKGQVEGIAAFKICRLCFVSPGSFTGLGL